MIPIKAKAPCGTPIRLYPREGEKPSPGQIVSCDESGAAELVYFSAAGVHWGHSVPHGSRFAVSYPAGMFWQFATDPEA